VGDLAVEGEKSQYGKNGRGEGEAKRGYLNIVQNRPVVQKTLTSHTGLGGSLRRQCMKEYRMKCKPLYQ
jgi:hypothetical protein